jgi:hypothetical protein
MRSRFVPKAEQMALCPAVSGNAINGLGQPAPSQGCAICLAVCPWSRPGVAENLVGKMARRRGRG